MTSEKLFEKLINNFHKNDDNGGTGAGAVTVRQPNGKLALYELKCEALEIIYQYLAQK